MSLPPAATFHGTEAEKLALLDAFNRGCTCQLDPETWLPVVPCSGHAMLIHDQRALNGLLFARCIADRLRAKELAGGPCTPLSVMLSPGGA